MADRLYRSRDDRMLAGVAAGVADALDADPSIIRIAWALLVIFTGGIAFIVYIVMAIVVPEYPYESGVRGPWSPPPGTPAAAPTPSAAPAPSAIPPTPYWADDREARRAARRARRAVGEPGRGGLVAGVILIVIGGVFLAREFVPWFDWNLWWPIGLIGLGALLLVVALQPGRSSD
jgi:phage shock protein PspC (stress-responsive transcriptional regulator)